MIIFKKAISRRTMLRGAGAACALPLLDGMVPALTALSKTAAKPAVRFGAVYVPNGMVMQNWRPATEGVGFELMPILDPLDPFRDQLLVLSSLNSTPPPGIRGGTHSRRVDEVPDGCAPRPVGSTGGAHLDGPAGRPGARAGDAVGVAGTRPGGR